jgi:hypothetical protein
VGILHPFDHAEEVIGVDALGIEHDDDPPDNGIHLRPVDAFNAAQRALHVSGDALLAGTPDGANLNMCPPVGHPDASMTATRVHPVESGADGGAQGIAQGGRNGSGRVANLTEDPDRLHAAPNEARQMQRC